MTLRMTIDELNDFLRDEFPQIADEYVIDDVKPDNLIVRMPVDGKHLRPGGTVSGPSMFSLADCAIYIAILSHLGPVSLAVTTNASIDFMRKPEAGKDLIATCRLLKLGRVLAVGEVLIFSEGNDKPVARASMTYSIPPNSKS